jgi:hypothetical protein
MQHTQGPWIAHVDIGEDTRGMGWIRTPDGRDVSCYGTQELWMSENIANGKLMAAAPELLEALKGVLRVADRKTDEFDAARAAIAKATE